MTLAEYVKQQVGTLIAEVEKQACEGSVHHLRVAIRRLSEGLRVFEDLFPHGAAKKVRRELHKAMRRAGDVRNHDIAEELLRRARVSPKHGFTQSRAQAARGLAGVQTRWREDAVGCRWRAELHV